MTTHKSTEVSFEDLIAVAKNHGLQAPISMQLARRLQTQPMVVDFSGTLHPRIVGFLDHLKLKARAPKTLQTYAEGLDRILLHLGTSGSHTLSLMTLTPSDVYYLREKIVGPPPFNGKRQAATWNSTVAALKAYLKWEKHHGKSFFSPITDQRGERGSGDFERLQEFLAETRLKTASNKARPLASKVIECLLAELSETYALMAHWELRTGLRAFELAGLTTEHYENLCKKWARGEKVAQGKVTRKGQKESYFYAVHHLQQLTTHYFTVRRPALVKRYGQSSALFLNDEGEPVKSLNYVKAVASAARRIDIPERSHSLRATFGRMILDEANKLKDAGSAIVPILITKDLMDHVRTETTIKYVEEVQTALLNIEEVLAQT